MSNDLESLDPRTAKQMYLDERRNELAEATLQSQHYRLRQFVEWCEHEEIDNLNEFSGRDIHQYRVKRRNEDQLANASMKGHLATLRMFLRFCATIDAVEPGLGEKILLPTTTDNDARETMFDSDRAESVLNYLRCYRYATLEHAFLEVLWHTGLRIGAATGLDINDFDDEERYLRLVHRPDLGTSLKTRTKGERLVALSGRMCQVLNDWLEVNHPETVDEYSRNPLFATKNGRLSKNRGRTIAYQFTRPCIYDRHCPHEQEPDHCDAAATDAASKYPS